jgi:anti-sigma factor RsiW
MTHLDDETLSALIDDELDASAKDASRLHIASCAECRSRLENLRGASAAFKHSGTLAMPAGVAARTKDAAAKGSRGPALLKMGAVASIGLFLFAMAGVALKKFMPTLFNNIQQMITGAASQMGYGGN